MERFLGIVYGPPKCGKTASLLAGLPCSLFISALTGLDSAQFLDLNITGRAKVCTTVADATAIIEAYHTKFSSIVVDEFSILCDASFSLLEDKYLPDRNKVGFHFNKEVGDFFRAVDAAKTCDIAISMHEQNPRDTKKGAIMGTVKVPGWQWPEGIPARFSFVARMAKDESFPGPWKWVYQTDSDGTFATGDRYGINPSGKCYPSIGEILRAAGRTIPRPPELKWHEPVIEAVATQLNEQWDKPDFKLGAFLRDKYVSIQAKGISTNQKHINWALRDALARAHLRRALAVEGDKFLAGFDESTSANTI